MGQMLDECHVLLPDAGLGMEVPSEVTNHVVSVVFEAGGPHPRLCWAFIIAESSQLDASVTDQWSLGLGVTLST